MKSLLRARFPEQTELRRMFLLLLVYGNSFAFIAYAKTANTLTNFFGLCDMLGILAYDLMIALLEASFVFAVLMVVAFILPKKFFADHFVPRSTALIVTLLIFLYPLVAPLSAKGLDIFYTPMLDADSSGAAIASWGGMVALLGLLLGFALSRPIILKLFDDLVERLTVLGWFFLGFDLLSILLVIFRNIWPEV